MRRRIVTVVLLSAALSGAASGAQALGGSRPEAGGYWGCAGTRLTDLGVCLKNPLPERLPLPSVPPAPVPI